MGCEYCTGKKAYEDINETDKFLVEILNNELNIEIEFGNRDARYYESFRINFCPNCGIALGLL